MMNGPSSRSERRSARSSLIALVVLLLSGGITLAASGDDARETSQGDDLGLTFEAVVTGVSGPMMVAEPPDGSGRLFVVNKAGIIRVAIDGTLQDEPFLDITDLVVDEFDESGLFSVVFHPEFVDNGLFFVAYSSVDETNSVTRFQVSADDPNRADPASAQVVLAIPDQVPKYHNGGGLAFGPDGYLYIGAGDDTHEDNPQNLQALQGKMLRIDPSTGQVQPGEPAYAIPPDNPLVGRDDARPEIWASGLRNPWRFSFDRETGDLYIADVGQSDWEEVNFQPAGSSGGENYGWPIMEGSHCFPPDEQACAQAGLTLPAAEYGHDEGCAVIGGYVYRGSQSPSLLGTYLFADICSGNVWGLSRETGGGWDMRLLATTSLTITSFAEDRNGELYVTTFENGAVRRIVATRDIPDDAPAFDEIWARTDQPVASGAAVRTWIWGPQETREVRVEPYAEAPGGVRTVMYFDKARMEITNPDADPGSNWYVTNGLLVNELITGRLQLGDGQFDQREPAGLNVAGDPDDPDGPVYATFAGLLDAPPSPFDRPVIQRLTRDGTVTSDDALAGYGVEVAALDDVSGHAIAAPFWEFMNAEGAILIDGQLQTGPLFTDPLFATGRPVTEAYWATVKVAGQNMDVLMQCFERRCLTYTPDNEPAWQVEAGNVGQHYFQWRYGG
jgi:glucose/arabinose dehydrogenase